MDADRRSDPQAQDACPIENLNLPPVDPAAERFRGCEGPGGDDAGFGNVELLPRRSFEDLQHRKQAEQGEESLATDGPVVGECRKADDPAGSREGVEERVHNEEEEVAAEGAANGQA